ncbi:radical SAM protein [Methylovulum sp.]|uniref:radical SAM protein n=1 Tax=Methylovulum sp. TaxID=1916980 RepID=UPI0026208ACD|nr:radical SAM protein [Methylovulum sp.]MDD2801118.1 radical SAM protein [Methylococcales bacterium]MDD5126076.1 radical SAM protein [Methylovulum sp.]
MELDNNSKIKTATLELTKNCNFQCKHCYIETVFKGGDILKSNQWLFILRRLLSIGCNQYVLTGGEVMMSASFFDVYSYLKENSCQVDIFTNGSILKESHLTLFSKYPPDSVSITIYGSSFSEYRATTGCASSVYQTVMRNIDRLKSLGFTVNIGSLLCKSLSDGLNTGNNEEHYNPEFNTYLMPALYKKENLTERLSPKEILDIEINNEARNKNNIKIYSSLKKLRKNSPEYLKKCSGGYSSIFISASGLASICAIYRAVAFNMLNEELSMSYILGALHQVHIKFKEQYFNGKCGSCEFNQICRNCPAYSLLETSHVDENPYLCELAKVRAKHYLTK